MHPLTLIVDALLTPVSVAGCWFMFRQLDALAATLTAYRARRTP
jgi:hypothetical protein